MSTNFHALTISKITKEAAKTVAISFNIPSELKETFKFTAGQYLTLNSIINGEDVRRSYSICSSPNEEEITVAVKAIENGKFSNFAYNQLNEGDSLKVMAPMGNFIVKNAEENGTHVFYAAGSGITPVLSMIKALTANNAACKIELFYGNRSINDIIFKSDLDALAAKYDGLNVHYILSREDSGSKLLNGRIDASKCSDLYNSFLSDASIAGVYLCGPEAMINTVRDFYNLKNFDKSKIHFELFTTPSIEQDAKPKMAGEVVNSQVTVIIDDEEYEFELSSNGKNILQAAQDEGADVPFSCKGGVCCTCRAKIMEGSASMDMNFSLEESEIEEGFVLTCQAHPTSDKIVVSFDEY